MSLEIFVAIVGIVIGGRYLLRKLALGTDLSSMRENTRLYHQERLEDKQPRQRY